MKKNRMPCLGAMTCMIVLSLTNFFGIRIAGISVIIGVIFFFINKALTKQPSKDSGFNIKAVPTHLTNGSIWFLIALPLIADAIQILIGKLLLPDYINHVLARTSNILSFEKIVPLIFQLLILALGEEIAWRAFFQNQLQKATSSIWAIILTSLFFCFGHIANGSLYIVVVDITFVFINSILYGMIFKKTNNAWISFIAHFLANLFSIIVLVFI